MFSRVLLSVVLSAVYVSAAPSSGPTVTLDNANFVGTNFLATEKYLGIPFAQPPVGDLRFRLPQPIAYNSGATYNAKSFGLSCPQQSIELPIVTGLAASAVDFIVNSIFGKLFPDSEDCLTLNVVKPSDAGPGSNLPVVVWMFGGGFILGGSSMYDGSTIVTQSQALGQDVVYVSMNYRVTAFGFLPGKEVKEAGVGNLGLQDQRLALKWVQKYISQFGGDPTKVTLWGESAGAISTSLHMVSNGGDTGGLFRAAFMESGGPIPVGDITNGQNYYDAIVAETGCTGAADTLQCLREVPYAKLKAAVNLSPGIFSYQSLSLAWTPRVDGVFLSDSPQALVQQGKVAKIPFVTGNCDDEGTLFSLSTLNITTDDQFKGYMKNTFLPGLSQAQVDTIADLYPSDITQGSPYSTGILNALTPQFKRIAAVLGDGVFQAPRRWLVQNTASKQPVFVYLNKRLKALPVLGTAHATDILNVYAGGDMGVHLINFANSLNPSPTFGFQWPQYSLSNRLMTVYQDGLFPLGLTTDTYRSAGTDFLTQATLQVTL